MLRRCWPATPIVIALLAFAPAATAAVTVDNSGDAAATGNDCMPAPNDCSLRRARAAAAPHGRVVIPAAVGKIELDSQLQVTKPLAIRGAGRDTTILSGQDKTRVLRIDASGGVTLARLRISHGRTKVTTPRAGGAGIFVRRGDLTLDRVRVTRNRLTATGASGMLVEDQGGAGVYSAH